MNGAEPLEAQLQEFARSNAINGKGPLSLVLVLTRKASKLPLPLNESDFLSPQGGQVAGLGRGSVQSILQEYGISRVLAEEGGRTSRGSIKRMRSYLDFLNRLGEDGELDFNRVERWWVERIRNFFAAKPISVKLDQNKSIRGIVVELLEAASERQSQCPGTMVIGAVLEHLVGAKLELALPGEQVLHKGFSVADASTNQKGDFHIGDTVVHVSSAPTEALLAKCKQNFDEGLRPLVVTTRDGADACRVLARTAGISSRLDVLEIDQFISTNLFEWSGFTQVRRVTTMRQLIARYNDIVSRCETDPSLKISIG